MRVLRDLVLWILIFLVPVTGWAYREEVGSVANRIYAVLVPGAAVSTGTREVTIARAGAHGFQVEGRINGASARFIFDTGASVVVLTPETARAAGIDVASLSYSATVSTANGRTNAAPVVLDRLAIGDITETRVEALVARPGALFENLLGMSFLSRLDSYQVTGQRLILRGRS